MNAPLPPPSTSRAAAWLAGLAALLVIVASIWLGSRMASIDSQLTAARGELTQLRQLAQLARLEARSQGSGIGAIIEQIDYWAPQLALSSTPMPEAERIEKALNECLDSIDGLGTRAWPELIATLDSPSSRDEEARKWLLRGAVRSRPDEGRALLASVIRGTRLTPSARLRIFAADELIRIDRETAGKVIAQVLQVESAQGITREAPPELAREYERVIGTNRFPEYFNLIDRYVATGDPDTINVLRMILGRPEHDRMTYQVCIRALGKLRAHDAVDRIKQLYSEPPRGESNPLFTNACLQAIADIDGAEACAWFQDQLRISTTPIVVAKLQDLVKQLCG